MIYLWAEVGYLNFIETANNNDFLRESKGGSQARRRAAPRRYNYSLWARDASVPSTWPRKINYLFRAD